jgi:hypothetical protein
MENQKEGYNLRSRARKNDVRNLHNAVQNRFKPVEIERKGQNNLNPPETLEDTYDPYCDDEAPIIKIGKNEPKDPKDRPVFREFRKRSEEKAQK